MVDIIKRNFDFLCVKSYSKNIESNKKDLALSSDSSSISESNNAKPQAPPPLTNQKQ